MFVECLVDSGSPVSLIKKVVVPAGAKSEDVKEIYYGLNKSTLSIVGKMKCYTEVLNKYDSVELLVVPNECMGYSVLLGRDFIETSDAKLKIGNVEFTQVEVENVVDKVENKNKVEKMHKVEKVSNLVVENKGKCEKVKSTEGANEGNISEVLNEIMAIDACEETDVDLKVGEQLSCREKESFVQMFRKIYVNSKKLREPLVRKEMRLALENDKPFACPPRRLSYSEKETLQKIIDEYLAKGYIRPSESEFVSPIVLVKKKTAELRLCVDYRKLNKVTVKDSYPMPLIDDLLDRLANKKIFTKLDLKNGFFTFL
ncbi:PREDICTED: uncharacterized protein LOC108369030 [Rhagoletis zephyria]|uniref:uncharacterized protein LOC108369030 n=1 Tax=Rhagoletis zephyria TaxID=28612 RepID=UPI0008112D4C|nr:PREDICTED: uncharacterized protein LOC108369030 [Rhagoletis zephyria]